MYPLPANAKRIRYLESTGTQYIDTGVVPTAQTSFEIEMTQVSSPHTFAPGGYCGDSYNASNTFGFAINNKNAVNSYFGTAVNVHVGDGGFGMGSRINVKFRRGNISIVLTNISTGNAYTSALNGSYTAGSRNLYILNGNTGTADLGHPACMKLYFCQIYDGSTLVRDFIPVRVGSGSSAVGYLFDRVSGTLFGNAGTGDFVLGPDVTYNVGVIPSRMMPMGVRKKPYDAEVEYLAGNSSKTAYVQTDIIPTASTKVEFVASYTTGATSGWFFATEDAYHNTNATNTTGQGFSFGWNYTEPFRLVYGGGFTRGPSNVFSADTPTAFTLQGGLLKCGNTTWADRSASTLTSSTWIALFANHRGNSVIEKSGDGYRLHSFTTTVSGVVTHKLIPVRIGSVGYFYDKITGAFYGNAGTGSFTLGPDK